MTAKVSDLRTYLADPQGYLGRPLHNFYLTSYREVRTSDPPSSTGRREDEAFGHGSYRVGQASCIATRNF